MRKPHDRGGWPTNEPIDRTEHPMKEWERRLEAMGRVMPGPELGRVTVARRFREDIPLKLFESMGYWDRRMFAMEARLIAEKVLTKEEIDRKVAELGPEKGRAEPAGEEHT